MKIYAAKPFFMKNAGLIMQLHKKADSHMCTFSGRLTKFSEHWFASIISLKLGNKNAATAKLRKFSALALEAFYQFM